MKVIENPFFILSLIEIPVMGYVPLFRKTRFLIERTRATFPRYS